MMERASAKDFIIGSTIRTPFDPPGLMRVDSVTETHVFGVYIGDHPMGYKAGSPALYLVRDWPIFLCFGRG